MSGSADAGRPPSLAGGPGIGAGGAAVVSPLKPAITKTMLTLFVIGDVLGAGIYALVGERRRRGRRGDLDGVPGRAGVLAALHRVRLRRAGDEVPAGGRRRAVRQHAPGASRSSPSSSRSRSCARRDVGRDAGARRSAATTCGVRRPAHGAGRRSSSCACVAAINFRGIPESVTAQHGADADRAVRPAAGGGHRPRLHRRRRRRRRRGRFEFKDGEAVPLAILGGASVAFFALIGFEDSVNVAEETQEPSRIYPGRLVRRPRDRRRDLPDRHDRRLDRRADRPADRLRRSAAGGRRSWGRCRMDDQGVLGDRPVRADQRGADQHDHGVAAGLRDGRAGDRAAPLGRVHAGPAHAVGRDPVHNARSRSC